MKLLRSAAALLFLLLAGPSNAQRLWSLEECIAYALHNNPKLKGQTALASEKGISARVSPMKLLPSVAAYVGNDFNWGRSVDVQELIIVDDRMSSSTSMSLSASLNLSEVAEGIFSIKEARSEYSLSLLEEEALRDEITIKVIRSFMELLLARQTRMDAGRSLCTMEEQERKVGLEVQSGIKSEADLLEIRARAAREKAELSSSMGKELSTRISLMNIIGLRGDVPFDIIYPSEEGLPEHDSLPSAEEIYSIVEGMPQMKASKLSERIVEHRISGSRCSTLPSIAVEGGYGTYYSSTSESKLWNQFNLNRNPSLTVGLTIPLLSKGTVIEREQTSTLKRKRAQTETSRIREELFSELASLVAEASSGRDRCEAARRSLLSSEEVMRASELKWTRGTISSTDYITAHNNLLNAESAFHQARFQYIFNLIIIDYYREGASKQK